MQPVTGYSGLPCKLGPDAAVLITYPVRISVTVEIHDGHRSIGILSGAAPVHSDAGSHGESQGVGLSRAFRFGHQYGCGKSLSMCAVADGVNGYFILTQSRCTHHRTFRIDTISGADILSRLGTVCHRKEFLPADVERISLDGFLVDFPVPDVFIMVRYSHLGNSDRLLSFIAVPCELAPSPVEHSVVEAVEAGEYGCGNGSDRYCPATGLQFSSVCTCLVEYGVAEDVQPGDRSVDQFIGYGKAHLYFPCRKSRDEEVAVHGGTVSPEAVGACHRIIPAVKQRARLVLQCKVDGGRFCVAVRGADGLELGNKNQPVSPDGVTGSEVNERIPCRSDVLVEHQALRGKRVSGGVAVEHGIPADVLPVDGTVCPDDEVHRGTVCSLRTEFAPEISCKYGVGRQEEASYFRLLAGLVRPYYREGEVIARLLLAEAAFIGYRSVHGKRCCGHLSGDVVRGTAVMSQILSGIGVCRNGSVDDVRIPFDRIPRT